MCDFFWQRTDIGGGGGGGADQQGGDLSDIIRSVTTGPPSSSSPGLNAAPDVSAWQFPLTSLDDFAAGCGERSLRDPLLHELTGTSIFGGCPEKPSDIGGGLFSRGFQIPPARPSSPRAIRPMPPPTAGSGDVVKVEHGVQITSPRTPAGVKRR